VLILLYTANYEYKIFPKSGNQLEFGTTFMSIFSKPASGNYLRGFTLISDGTNWKILSTINY